MLNITASADIAPAIARMELAERVAQLCCPILQSSDIPAHIAELVGEAGIGLLRYCINAEYDNASEVVGRPNRYLTPAENAELLNRLQRLACARTHGSPLLVSIDQEGGTRNDLNRYGALVYGSHMAFGAAGDLGLTERVAEASGRQMRAIGINLVQAPITDVISHAGRATIKAASFADDPAVVSRHALAMLRGFRRAGLAVMAKHFPGYGATAVDAHKGMAEVRTSAAELDAHDNIPLRAMVEAGVDGLMTGHVRIAALDPSGTPATLSRPIIDGCLRRAWGYAGLVVSDALRMRAIQEGYGTARAAVLAIQAGCDVVLLRGDEAHFREGHDAILAAARRGDIDPARIDASVARLLALKLRLGLFATPCVDPARAQPAFADPAARACGVELARRSVALLRGVPPPCAGRRIAVIAPEPSKIAGADDPVQSIDMLAQALRARHPQVTDLVVRPAPTADDRTAALRLAAAADVVVVATANAINQPAQVELARALLDLGKPTIVVASESPYDADLLPRAGTVLATFGSVRAAMDAAAEVMLGERAATGRPPIATRASASA